MTTRRAVLAAVLVASVALLIIVIGWEPAERAPSGPSTDLKIVVVGVDGLDWFLMRQFIEDGSLPAISSFLRRGITGEISADLPSIPETGWTILARGKDLTETERVRLSDGGRLFGLAPELVEVVARSGGKALSVGWPASWPVESSPAMVVAPYRQDASVHETALPAAIMAGDAVSSSSEVSDRVAAALARSESECEAEFRRRIFDGDSSDGWDEHLLAARWAFLSDLTTIEVAAGLLADEEPDLTMVCFGGMDAVTHRFLVSAAPSFFPETPPGHERYEAIYRNYFVFIDSCIERLRRLTDEDDTVFILCSTYGTHPSVDIPMISGAHTNGPPGVLILRGPDIPRRQRALSLSGVDLGPTILALLGVEIPLDMDGRVLQATLPPAIMSDHPPQYSGSIEPSGVEPATSDLEAAEARVSERLNSLRDGMTR